MGGTIDAPTIQALAARAFVPVIDEEGIATAQKRVAEALESAGVIKDINPKDGIGGTKIPFHLWPASATIAGALGLLEGMLKYGRTNWRGTDVRLSIYIDASLRHTYALFEGEDFDPDSQLPHECHVLACWAIIVDAKAAGTLIDDRQYPGNYREYINSMTGHVKRIKEIHKDKNPKHWTIRDKERRKS